MIQDSDVIGMRSEVILCDISAFSMKNIVILPSTWKSLHTPPGGGGGGVLRIYVDKLILQLFLSP